MYFLSCLIETHKGLELHEDKKIQQNVFFLCFWGEHTATQWRRPAQLWANPNERKVKL